MRFMVDRDIQGMSWLSLTAGKWRARPWTSEGTGHVVKKATRSSPYSHGTEPTLDSRRGRVRY